MKSTQGINRGSRCRVAITISMVTLLNACGGTVGTGAPKEVAVAVNPTVALLQKQFASAKIITNSPEDLGALKLDRSRSCVLVDAVRGTLSTAFFTQKLTKFAGLLKSEMTFEETYQVQTFMDFGANGLSTRVASAVSYAITQPAEVLFRMTEDGRLIEEWAIDGDEFLKSVSTTRGTHLSRASNLLGASIGNPSRFALFYILCE